METKSDSLLSKVASFFRERGSDEDAQPSTKSSRAAESEASLKTQAKLKKRDDAIREREFKDLRSIIKTRRSAQGLTDQDPPRPSLSAPGSTLNASNRASTLQKINVAEAQLEQWWGGASSGARNAPANARPAASTASASAAAATAPAKPAPAPSAPPPPDEDFDLDFTDLTPLTKAATATASSPAQTPTPALRPAPAPAPAPALKPAAAPAPPQALDLSLDFTMDKPAPPQAAAAKPLLNTSSPAPAPDSIEFTLDFTMETPAATPAPAAPPVATPQASEALEFTLDFTMDEPAATSTLAAPAFTAEQATVIESAPASQIEECLRDAAICYSEGDFGKAEELLLTTLKGQRLDGSEIELLTFALFDVYRATGQQSLFEVTAMDYAERVGRSPAEWFSIPEQLAAPGASAPATATPATPPTTSRKSAWKCPATLNNIALAQLQIEIGSGNTCRIDWNGLRNIEANAATTLSKLVQTWCNTPVRLEWVGVEALTQSLGLHTHQAAKREDEIWWRMHMDVLSILRQSEAFENLALDYCVAFEVSPPNPSTVQCTLVEDIPEAALDFDNLFGQAATPAPSAPAQADSSKTGNSGLASCALIGDICGDATQALQSLRAAAEKAQLLTVSCALLRRIDFSAANAIFNWTKARESSGTEIHFTQVPRLVLIFLLMLGLERHATLSMRNL